MNTNFSLYCFSKDASLSLISANFQRCIGAMITDLLVLPVSGYRQYDNIVAPIADKHFRYSKAILPLERKRFWR